MLLGLRVLAESLRWKPTLGGPERLAHSEGLKPESSILALPVWEWRQREFSGDQSLPEGEW